MRLAGLPALLLCALPYQAYAEPDWQRIGHIIVIPLENHSFDNLFGLFPGAEGLASASERSMQSDEDGKLYKTLPPARDTSSPDKGRDMHFPPNLPNRPFLIDAYLPSDAKTGDLLHRFYQQQEQINGGKMDRFAAVSDAGGLTMGYYDGSKTVLWRYAMQYTLADRFFHAAFGGSFLNHIWLACACTPRFDQAPEDMLTVLDKEGRVVKDRALTPDGYAVNTVFPAQGPHPANVPENHLLPPQAMPTIGDRLSEKGISWAWYGGGWDDALAGKPDSSFQFHHQPFAYFASFAPGSAQAEAHVKDGSAFLRDVKAGTLPAVSFYKPLGEFNLHPGYATVAKGDAHIAQVLEAIISSPVWKDSVVIVTFDENGGWWDHVAPPRRDRWGPGVRVPTLIISPFARRHFIDHTTYDTTSILALIEHRFGLEPLGKADAEAADLRASLILGEATAAQER